MLETGHTAFRTSIQWSRIFPQGSGKVNYQGVDFYRKVFEAIKAKGIRLLVNLYHFDLPLPFKRMVMVGKIRRLFQPMKTMLVFVLRLMEI